MEEIKQSLQRILRLGITILIVGAGITSLFLFPSQGLNILGSSTLIAFSYFTVLFRPHGQWLEFCVLMGVIGTTIFAYLFPNTSYGSLFLVQVGYFIYGMGKAFIFKLLKETFLHFTKSNPTE